MPIRNGDLHQSPSEQVIGDVQAPIITTAPRLFEAGAAMSLTLRTSGLMGTKGTTGVRGVSRSLSIHNSQALAWRKRLRQALSDRLAIPISTAQQPSCRKDRGQIT